MPAGGGWGDPLHRDPAKVLEDVLDEKLTVDHVWREYGVVIGADRRTVDAQATEQLRAQMRTQPNERVSLT